ncbi:hypothetical protein EIM50_13605 [Pseudoxanthomonas sp. SGD-10]|nr:hypothetical protein EIM50_13605 [Pseudoxanthomonas sp. SGD-10]
MHQCTTAAPAAQAAAPVILISDVMFVDHYARRVAARHQVPAKPVIAAGRSAFLFYLKREAGYRAADLAAFGLAVLQGRAC